MARRAAGRFIAWFRPDRTAGGPGLQQQIYLAIQQAVLKQELPPGERLPSTRALAADLGVSRNTVVNAFERLSLEGYLEVRPGAGVFVASEIAGDAIRPAFHTADMALSRRSDEFASLPAEGEFPNLGRPFTLGLPALDEFPVELWRRLALQELRRRPEMMLAPGNPLGLPELRMALARYLSDTRGVICAPENVVIVSGAQQALDLIGRLLLDPGDAVAVEDPGYLGARQALAGTGARLVPIAVDDQGIDPAAFAGMAAIPKLLALTPSHQFPLGMTLPLGRRLALLKIAHENGTWIVEDDYDCEYRYGGPPLQALQGLDGGHRVLYVGTFSKVLFPGLRLGYVVLPPALVDGFARIKAVADGYAPIWPQAVLAAFIAEGHLAQHVRRMRTLYRQRRSALLAALERHASGLLRPRRSDAGLHLVAEFVDGRDDRAAARRAAAAGLNVSPLSRYAMARHLSGVLLGFAAVPASEMDTAVQRLLAAFR